MCEFSAVISIIYAVILQVFILGILYSEENFRGSHASGVSKKGLGWQIFPTPKTDPVHLHFDLYTSCGNIIGKEGDWRECVGCFVPCFKGSPTQLPMLCGPHATFPCHAALLLQETKPTHVVCLGNASCSPAYHHRRTQRVS